MDHTQPNVVLRFWMQSDGEILEKFRLLEEQAQFTALPIEALKEATDDRSRYPVVIEYDGIPVGFFVLHYGKGISEYSSNPGAILLRALSMDLPYQGKGIAKQAMRLLPDFVRLHFPDRSEIVLAVNFQNIVAKRMYMESGYEDTGIIRDGKSGPQYLLQFKL